MDTNTVPDMQQVNAGRQQAAEEAYARLLKHQETEADRRFIAYELGLQFDRIFKEQS